MLCIRHPPQTPKWGHRFSKVSSGDGLSTFKIRLTPDYLEDFEDDFDDDFDDDFFEDNGSAIEFDFLKAMEGVMTEFCSFVLYFSPFFRSKYFQF